MSVAIITGSAGLIGSEAATYFAGEGLDIVGIDNDMRKQFFGEEASTAWSKERLIRNLHCYEHNDIDIRDKPEIFRVFKRYGKAVSLVIHTAAQPSHDWAARNPFEDFTVNANGTLLLLEATRQFAPDAVFIFTSTNKVYGDLPNHLPLTELDSRWELRPDHAWRRGIPEIMSIDRSTHSLFGVSKTSADLLVQEYGRYFGLRTACFRGGCLTGPGHSGTELHGFLAYLVRCATIGDPYTVFGYKCKQVRDNIHSVDLIRAFHEFFKRPRVAEVYNIGGGRSSNCSVLEAIELCQQITGQELQWRYVDQNRKGDHIWWISDFSHFQEHFPTWAPTFDVPGIITTIYEMNRDRWTKSCQTTGKRAFSAS
jgi:CDP-paratose 2-epimerase